MNLDDTKIRSIARKLAINPILPAIKQKTRDDTLCKFSALTQYPKEAILLSLKHDKGCGSKAVGCFLGLAIGNSSCLKWEGTSIDTITDKPQDPLPCNYEDGQYSDDTAMALCLAESLLVKCNFESLDAKLRWYHWWYSGYCNGLDNQLTKPIGSTMETAIDDMLTNKNYQFIKPSTDAGNGSLVRLAPVPILTRNHPEWCLMMSQLQSYATHGSELAAACCATLGYILFRLINHQSSNLSQVDFKTLLDQILVDWLDMYPTQLIPHPNRGEAEKNTIMYEVYQIIRQITQATADSPELNGIWNWRQEILDIQEVVNVRQYHIAYAKYGLRSNNYGTYCPDALSLALHVVYHAKTPEEIITRCQSLGGDADSIAAIAGQIMGAYYGYQYLTDNQIFSNYYHKLKRYDSDRITLTACLLYLRSN